MSFRRSSSLSRRDGLTLEQRLVMQLTAAMRHEDSSQAVEEHPGEPPSQQPAAQSENHQRINQYPGQYAPQDTLRPHQAPPGQTQDIHSMDANELSTMLRTLGASLESLGSAIGGNTEARPTPEAHIISDASSQQGLPQQGLPQQGLPQQGLSQQGLQHLGPQHHDLQHNGSTSPNNGLPIGTSAVPTDEGQTSAIENHATQSHVNHDNSLFSTLGSLENLGGLSQLNLGNLLSSVNTQDQSNLDLGASLETLGHLDLESLANLGALGNLQHGLPAATAEHETSAHQDTAMPLQPTDPQLNVSESQQPATQQRVPSPPPSEPSALNTTSEHANLGLSQVEIDPDVSSIQSVLQSLLTAGSSSGSGSTAASGEPASHEDASSNEPHTSATADTSLATTSDSNKDYDMPSLSNFGLETEDQMLVDSLRSAIENQLSGTSATAGPSSLDSSISVGDDSSPSAFHENRASPRTASKPRSQSRTKKPRSQSILQSDDLSSSSFREQNSDFGASDPDTLRAIQQALLSALGPSASSTSLTESITSELKTATSEPSQADADTAAISKQQAAAVTGSEFSQGLSTDLEQPSTQTATGKAAERILRVPAKKVATKVTKPTERDRQKLREENAARKRRWREENVLQNRDNDLRARIIRRAQTMYGEGDSTEKSEWIEAEYQRRRQKRILRADINSLVANAMESARSRAAKEQAGGHRVSDQPLTLTQQTRQIASSQLSELFRRSNAVLEPQLHSEKLSVPLAPYLLVPSPNRPPYKVDWKSRQSKATVTPPPKDPQVPSHSNDPTSSSDKGHDGSDNNKNTSATHKGPPTESNGDTDKGDTDKSDTLGSGVNNNKEPTGSPSSSSSPSATATAAAATTTVSPSSPVSPSSSRKPDESEKSPPPDAEPSVNVQSNLLSMRPKHRYGLVGNAQLGVPPNLAAIYQKLTMATSAVERA